MSSKIKTNCKDMLFTVIAEALVSQWEQQDDMINEILKVLHVREA